MNDSRATNAIVIDGLYKTYEGRRGGQRIIAVDDVSFAVEAGTTLGLVGESGSGKSTIARCLLGLLPVDRGRAHVLGHEITTGTARELRSWRRDMQIVFQEPYESLDPRIRVGSAIAEPLLLHRIVDRGADVKRRVLELMELVTLGPGLYDRLPHELSGGQQQRVNIARALATNPRVVVLDEPTSSLDVSVRAEILRLLARIQDEFQLTYLLISHDLVTVRAFCDRVAVMYLGRLVEEGPTAAVVERPAHPYTEFLLGSDLPLEPDELAPKPVVRSELAIRGPGGCVFVGRCPVSESQCASHQPELRVAGREHLAACVKVGAGTEALATTESSR